MPAFGLNQDRVKWCELCKQDSKTLVTGGGIKWSFKNHLQTHHHIDLLCYCPECGTEPGNFYFLAPKRKDDLRKHLIRQHNTPELAAGDLIPWVLVPYPYQGGVVCKYQGLRFVHTAPVPLRGEGTSGAIQRLSQQGEAGERPWETDSAQPRGRGKAKANPCLELESRPQEVKKDAPQPRPRTKVASRCTVILPEVNLRVPEQNDSSSSGKQKQKFHSI